jgi:hypothetical protein
VIPAYSFPTGNRLAPGMTGGTLAGGTWPPWGRGFKRQALVKE